MSHTLAKNDGMQPTEWDWAVQGDTCPTYDEGQPCAKQLAQNGSLQLLYIMQHT